MTDKHSDTRLGLRCFNCFESLYYHKSIVSCSKCDVMKYCSKKCRKADAQNDAARLCDRSHVSIRSRAQGGHKVVSKTHLLLGDVAHVSLEPHTADIDKKGTVDPTEMWPACTNKRGLRCHMNCNVCADYNDFDENIEFAVAMARFISSAKKGVLEGKASTGFVSIVLEMLMVTDNLDVANVQHLIMQNKSDVVVALVATKNIRMGEPIILYIGKESLKHVLFENTCFTLMSEFDPKLLVTNVDIQARYFAGLLNACGTNCAKSIVAAQLYDEHPVLVLCIYRYIYVLLKSNQAEKYRETFGQLFRFFYESNVDESTSAEALVGGRSSSGSK